MSDVFTRYIQQLTLGVEPTPQDWDAVWEKLHDALKSAMVQRSLWTAPPSYLGIYGWNSWTLPEAFSELLSDCYSFIFVHRLPGLQALLKTRPNIEGLVFRNIRNFLFEKQKRHDPLGYRVFVVVRIAIRQAIAEEILYVLAGDAKVGNQTLLGFRPEPEPAEGPGDGVSELVEAWSDQLLPELVTARGTRLDGVVSTLSSSLSQIAVQGIQCFRFKILIDPFKRAVRVRWQTLWQSSQGEFAYEDGDEAFVQLVGLVRPDSGLEEREAFEALISCVTAGLEGLQVRSKTRAYLERLWLFLRSHASEDVSVPGDGQALPTRRQLAGILEIPRYRFPELHGTLERLVEDCRTQESTPGDTRQDRRSS